MSQSLSSILVHIVFSTKNREPFITSGIETELHPYLATIFRELKSPALALDGTADHIHALCSLSRTMTIANLIEEVKTSSSKWIKPKVATSDSSNGNVDMEHSRLGNHKWRR